MSNLTVPAAAEGMPNVTRRTALRTLAAGSAAGALAASALIYVMPPNPVAVTDPCLAFLCGWNDATSGCDAAPSREQEPFWNTNCRPFEETAAWGVVPAATTSEGAAAALRKALAFDDMEPQDANLVRAALAYLEGRA